MKILFAAAEGAPYIKIGGLGDVAYALPKALAEAGEEVSVVLPLYKSIKEREGASLQFITSFSVPLSWRQAYCGVFMQTLGSVTYYFIDNEYYFFRDHVYGSYDDGERFAFFSKAVLEMLKHLNFFPDVIHANDWQCALIPLFLKAFYQEMELYRPIKTMFTIHNIEYQGKTGYSFSDEVLGIPEAFKQYISHDGCLNFMFSAVCLADKVTTVSGTYAEELKMPYYGKELADVLQGVSYKFCGITNGIDPDVFNPQTDVHLYHKFSIKSMGGKKIGKRRLREHLGLHQDEEVPIVSVVSRLVGHKGLDLIQYVRHEMMERRMQLIVVGTGDAEYENMFRELSYQYPGRVSANICFNTDLASKVYAASDLFLMPSKSEPCGLSQMIAMRYGAIPIVRETGGLKDTVWPIDPETAQGRGFTFKSYNAHDMLDAIDRSLWFFYEKKQALKDVVRSNMQTDFSWKGAASLYRAIYESMEKLTPQAAAERSFWKMQYDKTTLQAKVEEMLMRRFGCEAKEATFMQFYRAVCLLMRDILTEKRSAFAQKVKKQSAKNVYYMSMEFLTGPSLKNHAFNLGLTEALTEALKEYDISFEELCQTEPDAGLGNGGLGRLASCYLDALTTQNVPCTGFSIRYEFGIFKQKIVDGWQMEFPDNWLEKGDVWLTPREEDAISVRFGGHVSENWSDGKNTVSYHDYSTVIAVPYDMMISGYDSPSVNRLVLWSAKSPESLDMDLFSRGEYVKAMEENSMAEAISKVLYPADDHYKGKELRLKQQYLLVSASVQSIMKDFLKETDDIFKLPERVAIHINDTHPSLCVPELMRILLDEHGLGWEDAWELTSKTLSYTNHTIMSEALEVWPVSLFSSLLPRIYQIVCEIDRRFSVFLHEQYGNDIAKINYMKIVENDRIKMANLCLCCCHKVNGVSALHTQILTQDIFHDFHNVMPGKFLNVTNGIAYRRWLCQANPDLTNFLKQTIGEGFLQDANALVALESFKNDQSVLDELQKIKLKNKLRLVSYIAEHNGIQVDPASLFDVQIKRLHEYKRQLLNALHILYLYHSLLENPSMDMQPKTFIFGAKASAGYIKAKQIIRLINSIAAEVNANPVTRDKLKVVFLEDYRVSLAELIIPASEISEQISVAGKEASGTGNMKLMINGAVTLGTLDGANVEIKEAVGDDNIFIFGMTAEEVMVRLREGYNPADVLAKDPVSRQVIDYLRHGINGTDFSDLASGLTGIGQDLYMTLADFASYRNIHKEVDAAYKDRNAFNRMSLMNIAKAGIFSSDRSVLEYCEKIWHAKSV